MNKWVLSIGFLAILSSVLTIILPNGKMEKCVKGVFATLFTFIVINPFFNFDNNGWTFNFTNNDYEITYQEEYLNNVANQKELIIKENCQNILKYYGINNVTISIDYTVDKNGQTIIEKIIFDATSLEYLGEEDSIIAMDKALLSIKSYLNLDLDKLVVNYG